MRARSREWELEFATEGGSTLRAYGQREHLHFGIYSRGSGGCSSAFSISRLLERDPKLGFNRDGSWTPFAGLFDDGEQRLTESEAKRVLDYCLAYEGLLSVASRGPRSRPSELAEQPR